MAAGIGWGVMAMLLFGSCQVPLKSPAVMAAAVDPVVFQSAAISPPAPCQPGLFTALRTCRRCYKTVSCFTTCWLTLLVVPLRFSWWGVVGAAMWVVNGVMASAAIQRAGIGVAQAIYSGFSVLVSFIWGAYYFGEPVAHLTGAWASLAVMCVGMATIGLAAALGGQPRPAKDADDSAEKYKPRAPAAPALGAGVCLALYVGFANGSKMVPWKLASLSLEASGGLKGTEYLVSFGVGSALCTVCVACGYALALRGLGRPLPPLHLETAAGPGLLTGLMWSGGNLCSIRCTEILGLAAGWPLVQAQLLVSTAWGVLWFAEVRETKCVALTFGGALATVGGLACFAQCYAP